MFYLKKVTEGVTDVDVFKYVNRFRTEFVNILVNSKSSQGPELLQEDIHQ